MELHGIPTADKPTVAERFRSAWFVARRRVARSLHSSSSTRRVGLERLTLARIESIRPSAAMQALENVAPTEVAAADELSVLAFAPAGGLFASVRASALGVASRIRTDGLATAMRRSHRSLPVTAVQHSGPPRLV